MISFSKKMRGGRRSRQSALMTSVAICGLAFAGQAFAEEEASVEEVVVTASPIRESLEKSLQIQKASDNVVNVIAADTIGRFPDATAAGALARLPGVGVQRDQGQERYIQIRGAPTRWTTVALDGINVLGAEDRVFRFDSVPANQISELVLNKTLLPNMPAEALAGRVNITTYSPLDNPGFSGAADLGYGFIDMGDGPVKQYSGRLSWANDTWGITLAASNYQFEQHTNNAESRFDDVGITQLRITKYVIERRTQSYSGKVQFAPDDNNRFTLHHLNTEFNDFEERNQYRFQYDKAWSGTRNFETADLIGVPVDSQWEDGIFSNGVSFTDLHGEHTWGGWDVDWRLAYTTTEFNSNIPLTSGVTSTALGAPTRANALISPSMHLQVNAIPEGVPRATLYGTVAGPDGTLVRGDRWFALDQSSRALPITYTTESSANLETEAKTAKFDASREWTSFGADSKFSFGFQYDDREQNNYSTALVRPDGTVVSGNANGFNLTKIAGELGVPWTPDAFITSNAWDKPWDFGFLATYMDNVAMNEQARAVMDAARAANANGGNYPIFAADPRSVNVVQEKVASVYAMNRWDWGRHSVTAGARIENTQIDTSGFAAVGSKLTAVDFSTDKTKVFPSIHYNFDYSDTLKLRAALISGHARPSLADMRATVSISDPGLTVSGGNPNLVPESAYGVDLSAEWYFAPSSLLAASFFHREIKDTLFDSTEIVRDERYNFDGVDRRGYTFSTTMNGGDGHLTGLELVYNQPWTFLPGALSGFGFQGSMAFVSGEFTPPEGGEAINFPGTSKRLFNATLFYEKYGLSARLSYQHRTHWLDEVFASGSSSAGNIYWGASQRVDLSVRYQVNDYVSVFMDGNNLTNETGVRYQGSEDRPYEIENFGRKFLFGVRANF
ncbi:MULTISPECIES: TonB-dependent receptor [Phenylobacterium]|uniref:TonB-dependent receptor n=1 Tax=Phenylobacterium koreense TaxID=266125 RepID=A0ABV2EFR1_9CAUL